MAAYTDLYDAIGTLTALDKKIVVALAIKANVLAKLASPTAAQKSFAVSALSEPNKYLPLIRNYIIAEYNTQSLTVISGATDTQVQTAVNASVDTLLGA